jgi:hypothetical protein
MTHSIGTARSIGALTRRRLLAGLGAGLGGGLAIAAQDEGPDDNLHATQPLEVHANQLVNFQPTRPDMRRFGDLKYRGGLVLTSPSPHFGGWSGLVMDADGKRLLSISDTGPWMCANVEYDDAGAPAALTHARIGPLRAVGGRPLRIKREQDAESLVLVDGSLERGNLLIGFEHIHRIGRFDVVGGEIQAPTGYLRLPAEAARMSPNQGLEALAVLRAGPLKGAVVAFAERFTRGSGYHTGWIWVDGQPQRIQLQDIDGFNITDAAGLPDGGLLVLERYFRWSTGVKMRIRRLTPGEIKPGAKLTGRVVCEADQGCEIDNMEGIAVHPGARGETIVSIISDDNFNHFLQRNVFLQFTLLE